MAATSKPIRKMAKSIGRTAAIEKAHSKPSLKNIINPKGRVKKGLKIESKLHQAVRKENIEGTYGSKKSHSTAQSNRKEVAKSLHSKVPKSMKRLESHVKKFQES